MSGNSLLFGSLLGGSANPMDTATGASQRQLVFLPSVNPHPPLISLPQTYASPEWQELPPTL